MKIHVFSRVQCPHIELVQSVFRVYGPELPSLSVDLVGVVGVSGDLGPV